MPAVHALSLAAGLAVALAAPSLSAQPANQRPLAPVEFLAGGTWRAQARWPDGSPLDVEVRYAWGPTRRVLHFVTHDLSSGERRLLYEGLLFHDPAHDAVVQWNIRTSGDIDVQQILRADSTGYEIGGANTRSVIHRRTPDEFEWELRVPEGSAWRTILRAIYRREGRGCASASGACLRQRSDSGARVVLLTHWSRDGNAPSTGRRLIPAPWHRAPRRVRSLEVRRAAPTPAPSAPRRSAR